MLEIRNAVVIKGGNKLFDDLTWKVRDGEHWVISGPNGSGKTTLLEIISVSRQRGGYCAGCEHCLPRL